MKKFMAFIFAIALILNLLPQTSVALRLSENNNSVIYDAFEGEKEEWEQIYLPHAIHSKLVGRNATMLDIAKIAQEEQEKNISAYTIIHKIIDITNHERGKMLVKWEKDNGYIDTEGEEDFKITPTLRYTLLKEIAEEEEKEKKERSQSWWKRGKAAVKVGSFTATLGISKWLAKDWENAGKYATVAVLAFTTILEVTEAAWSWIEEAKKKEEEIKLPPLRNLPDIPKDHKKIDIYSL